MEKNKPKFAQPTEAIASLEPYENSSHSAVVFDKTSTTLKLDSNETSASPSPKVIEAIVHFIKNNHLNWYPDVDSLKLREKISSYTGFPIDFIQTFNGSDNALECIARTYLEKGDEVVACAPTYDHFRVYAQSCGGKIVPVYGEDPFEPKPELLAKAVTEKTKLIYIVNPNNPTGILYSEEQINHVLKNARDAIVIIDEAYYEFCGVTMASFADRHPNIIITRSFSKAFGLAGLRCGYVICNPEHIKNINKVRIGKNINSLAQVGAIAALDDLEYCQKYIEETNKAKQWLIERFTSEGLKVVDTPANFILVKVTGPKEVVNFLESRGVYIRNRCSTPSLDGFVRITTAPISVMEKLWNIIGDIPKALL